MLMRYGHAINNCDCAGKHFPNLYDVFARHAKPIIRKVVREEVQTGQGER